MIEGPNSPGFKDKLSREELLNMYLPHLMTGKKRRIRARRKGRIEQNEIKHFVVLISRNFCHGWDYWSDVLQNVKEDLPVGLIVFSGNYKRNPGK